METDARGLLDRSVCSVVTDPPPQTRVRRDSADRAGFSLVETLVAVTILAVALASLAQLFGVAAAANQRARRTTLASLLARQKMEELRSLAWDAAPGPSPAGVLETDVDGYCDFLDALGQRFDSPATSAGAAFVRRWSIEGFGTDPGRGTVLRVVVVAADRVVYARLTSIRARRRD
jgi:prepilin-type N-terminal cleavage/methylation domain-containing protein